MIHASVLTFDETSTWDPKVIREHLQIPEDQLNILNNLPEWSTSKNTHENELRIEAGNSQSSKIIFCTSEKSQVTKKQNINLFEEKFEFRRKLLDPYKFSTKKLSRSLSLFEIDEINRNLDNPIQLKSALSDPNLYLLSKNTYSNNPSLEFESENSLLEKYLSSLKLKVKNKLLVPKEIAITSLIGHKNISGQGIRRNSVTGLENSKMEVVSPMPITVSSRIDKTDNRETDFEKTVDNALSKSSAFQSLGDHSSFGNCNSNLSEKIPVLDKSDVSSSVENKVTDTSVVKDVFTNTENPVLNNDKTTKLTESEVLHSHENNVNTSCFVKHSVLNGTDNFDKTSNLAEPQSSNASERSGTDLSVIKESVFTNNGNLDDPGKNTKLAESCGKVETDSLVMKKTNLKNVSSASEIKEVNVQKRVEENKVSDKCLKSPAEEIMTSKTNLVATNEPENKISCKLYDSKMDAQQTVHQEVNDNTSEFAQKLSAKRKLESKNRSSKRRRSARDKEGYQEKRSIKKAGEICYTVEHVKTMLDIMKVYMNF